MVHVSKNVSSGDNKNQVSIIETDDAKRLYFFNDSCEQMTVLMVPPINLPKELLKAHDPSLIITAKNITAIVAAGKMDGHHGVCIHKLSK